MRRRYVILAACGAFLLFAGQSPAQPGDAAGEKAATGDAAVSGAPVSSAGPPGTIAAEISAAVASDKPRVQPAVTIVIPEIDFVKTPLQTALAELAHKSGLPIVTEIDIDPELTLSLKNISVWDALTFLAKNYDLAYVLSQDQVRIMTAAAFEQEYGSRFSENLAARMIPVRYADWAGLQLALNKMLSPEGKIFVDAKNHVLVLLDTVPVVEKMAALIKEQDIPPVETRTFVLSYVKPVQILERVQAAVSKDRGRVSVHKERNALEVTESVEKLPAIKELIASLDKKREWPLKAQILKVQLNEEHQSGVDWEAIVSDYQRMHVYGETQNGPPEVNRLSLGTLTQEDYPVLVDALDAAGLVTTVYNGAMTPVFEQQLRTDWDTMAAGAENPDAEGFALELDIKPEYMTNQVFQVSLVPHLHWLADNPPSLTYGPDDAFDPQEQYQIRMMEDDVIVIGGLLREETVSQTSKVPLLGDLPFLGSIFRNQNQLVERTEYILFLIPERPQAVKSNEILDD